MSPDSTAAAAFASAPEALVVGLARSGDSAAFAELVRRRQSWIRTLMRRCCGDVTEADDLAQQVFLKAWQDISGLRDARGFGSWLRTLAINVWRQSLRKQDLLQGAEEIGTEMAPTVNPAAGMDLERALDTLSAAARMCVVLSYHEGLTHEEIAQSTGIPSGTVKSHIRRATARLREVLSAYRESAGQKGA